MTSFDISLFIFYKKVLTPKFFYDYGVTKLEIVSSFVRNGFFFDELTLSVFLSSLSLSVEFLLDVLVVWALFFLASKFDELLVEFADDPLLGVIFLIDDILVD